MTSFTKVWNLVCVVGYVGIALFSIYHATKVPYPNHIPWVASFAIFWREAGRCLDELI